MASLLPFLSVALGLRALGLPAQGPAAVALVPMGMYNKTPFVVLTLEGAPRPLRFVLDPSVVPTYIDRASAVRMGLAVSGDDSAATRRQVTPAPHAFLASCPVPLTDLRIVDLSMDFPAVGQAFDGILGSELFQAYVVEVDHEVGLLRLYDRARFAYYGDGQALDFTLIDGRPHVQATLRVRGMRPVTRLYRLDFGTGDAINDDLFKQSTGGRQDLGDLGRADLLEIGRFRFTGVNGTAGGPLLGEELLRRFNLTFDYAHHRLFLEPTRHLHDAFVFDMSGLSYTLTPDLRNVVINRVARGTPGEESGLRAGDLITQIDGVAVETLGLDTVLRIFEEPHQYDLTIRRAAEVFHVTLRLRPLL